MQRCGLHKLGVAQTRKRKAYIQTDADRERHTYRQMLTPNYIADFTNFFGGTDIHAM